MKTVKWFQTGGPMADSPAARTGSELSDTAAAAAPTGGGRRLLRAAPHMCSLPSAPFVASCSWWFTAPRSKVYRSGSRSASRVAPAHRPTFQKFRAGSLRCACGRMGAGKYGLGRSHRTVQVPVIHQRPQQVALVLRQLDVSRRLAVGAGVAAVRDHVEGAQGDGRRVDVVGVGRGGAGVDPGRRQ